MAEKSPPRPRARRGAQKKKHKPKGGPKKAKPMVCPGMGCSVPERIAWITHVMARNEWLGRKSIHALSIAWGITHSTVRHASAEASRRLQLDPAELDAERERLAEEAAEARLAAKSMRSKVTGLPDFMAWLKAIELYGRYRGVDPDAPLASASQGVQTALRVVVEQEDEEPEGASAAAMPAAC